MRDNYLQSMLGQNEQVVYATRQHWLVLAGEIVSECVLASALFIAITVMWWNWSTATTIPLWYVLLLLPLVSLLRDTYIWHSRKYLVTNKRVIYITGIFNKDVSDSALEKVTDIKLEQSFLGRLFDYGDVTILTASELGASRFRRIFHPVALKTAMLNVKDGLDAPQPSQHSHHEQAVEEPAAVPVVHSAGVGLVELLVQLHQLHKDGILSTSEYEAKKSEILAKLVP